MKTLPNQLAPWHPWLSLFPFELAEPLGSMLLRLHRVVGPLRSAPARTDSLPEGVGSIVQRGPYERMLMTEWAYADAEPDEFIRRAASGELLFTGPEPAARQRSRRCVVLFDAGPLQLGEPRLLHLVLFILLARRAAEAGAAFAWGVLQRPGILSADSGATGIVAMLDARTASAVLKESRPDWDGVLDYADDDIWVIGSGAVPPLLPGARTQVAIRHSLLAPELEVTLTTQRDSSKISLPLPAARIGTRLLREPFNAVASTKIQRVTSTRPSLQLAPVFSLYDSRLGVPMIDGSVVIYHIPQSSRTDVARPRTVVKANQRGVLGIAIYAKTAGVVSSVAGKLVLTGFPGAVAGKENFTFERPPIEQFNVTANTARWLPLFHQRNRGPFPEQGLAEETRILMVDLRGQLVCFSTKRYERNFASGSNPAFQCVAQKVTGAVQFDQDILFATADGTTQIHRLANNGKITRHATLRDAQQVLFGYAPSWGSAASQGLLALRYSETEWIVSWGHTSFVAHVDDKNRVLGVAHSYKRGAYGLVVIRPDRKSIELRTAHEVITLLTTEEEMQHAVLNAGNGKLAWVGRHSFRIGAKALDDEQLMLDIVVEHQDP